MTPKFDFTSGPLDAQIAIVGEAWGSDEAVAQKPFVGLSGMELTRLLADAGIDRDKCFLSNLGARRPVVNVVVRGGARGAGEGRGGEGVGGRRGWGGGGQ